MQLQDNLNLKTMIIKAHLSTNMMDILPMEKYRISIKPNFDTACWNFDFPTETHRIYIGDKIFERTIDNFNDNQKIVLSYFIHEAAHSIYTTKNLKALSKKLKEEKLNFKLYNLFEDARIEYKIRQTFAYNFNWTDFEGIPQDDKNEKPSTTLFKIIQTEDKLSFDVPYYEKVKEYYSKIVTAKNEDEMIKIMLEWNKDFPKDIEPEHNKNMSNGKGNNSPQQNQEGEDNSKGQSSPGEEDTEIKNKSDENQKNSKKKGSNKQKQEEEKEEKEEKEKSDLELAAEMQENPDIQDEFDNDIEIIVGDAKAQLEDLEQELAESEQNSVKILDEVQSNNALQLETSNVSTMFLDRQFDEKAVFTEKLSAAEERLKRILKSIDIETVNSINHDKKFNIKGVVEAFNGNTSAKPYKKSVEESYEDVKKKVFILMDGSGSMSGLPVQNMRTFAVVANRLAAQNLFEGSIGGSKVIKGKAVSQAFTMPINDGYITSFRADANAEGLGYAIERHIEDMRLSDYIFILTDGQIHDKELGALRNTYPDIYNKTIGIYMGEKRHSNEKMMNEWFKNSIIDSKFENIIEEIVYLLEPNSNPAQKLMEMDLKKKNESAHNDYIEQTFNFNRI